MNDTDTIHPPAADTGQRGVLDALGRRLVLAQLGRLRRGRLTLVDSGERFEFGTAGPGPHAVVEVSDPRFFGLTAFGGTVGAAEAYLSGYWNSANLTRVVRLLLANRDVLEGMEGGAAALSAPLRKLAHWLNRNTRRGSRRNIAAHYDLGNEFFALWLDPTMMYSCAVFEREDMTLEQASTAKLDRICRKLELDASDHVLEIGTGWGGFALHAAGRYGCRVTTTTISREQYEYAKARIAAAGLEDRVECLLKDYRDLDGRYDKVVSIEMVEAVGHEYLDTYLEQCSTLLEDDGMLLLQAITIADQRYRDALKSVDFIQKFIFPGGFLPSVTALLDAATRATDMRIYHLEDIGAHYAITLRRWREAFTHNLARIWELGFDEPFVRMWHYYYCYCEGAFAERAIGNVQLLFVKPGARRAPIVPPLAGS